MIRIGIICPSEIALRRFLPALKLLNNFKFIGVAIADKTEWERVNDGIIAIEKEKEKANVIIENYGGKIFNSYLSIIKSDKIDAVYLPLPPALHYKWAKEALCAGKHVLLEKPATTSFEETKELIDLAKKRGLTVHENYMFTFHQQLKAIESIVKNGKIGEVRLYRMAFGFPRRNKKEIRKMIREYCKERLSSYKIPTKITLVESVSFGDRFKKKRIS